LRELAGWPAPERKDADVDEWDAVDLGHWVPNEMPVAALVDALDFRKFLPFVVPLALEHLEPNPVLQAKYYPGDLLATLLKVPAEYWLDHGTQYALLHSLLGPIEDLHIRIADFRSRLATSGS
jgi:CDI immunity proteins